MLNGRAHEAASDDGSSPKAFLPSLTRIQEAKQSEGKRRNAQMHLLA